MQTNDFARFRAVLAGMAELYQRELTNELLDAYWLSLRRWELEDFEIAAGHLMETGKFMPRPADFTEVRKAGRPTAGEAWARAVTACGSCHSAQGYTSGGTCGDQFVDRVVRAIGGYKTIAMCDEDKLHFLERRFAEHFETMQEAQDVRDDVPQVAYMPRPAIEGPRHIGEIGTSDEWH